MTIGTSYEVSWSHPASFVAACFVYIGFFVVSNFYGGGAPRDMIPAIAPQLQDNHVMTCEVQDHIRI